MGLDCCHRCTTFSYRDFLSTAATEHSHKFCLLCFLYFSMALQSFLLSLLVLNMCWRSESACTMANWWRAFDRKGWATCDSSTQYIKGLWRNHNGGLNEKISLLEEAKCCLAPRHMRTSRQLVKLPTGGTFWMGEKILVSHYVIKIQTEELLILLSFTFMKH